MNCSYICIVFNAHAECVKLGKSVLSWIWNTSGDIIAKHTDIEKGWIVFFTKFLQNQVKITQFTSKSGLRYYSREEQADPGLSVLSQVMNL